jgi:hypothetical protein
MIPDKDELTICFAHVAYQLGPRFAARNRGIRYLQASSREELESCIGEVNCLLSRASGAMMALGKGDADTVHAEDHGGRKQIILR